MSTAVVIIYLAIIVAWAFVATTWAWTSADSDSQTNSKTLEFPPATPDE